MWFFITGRWMILMWISKLTVLIVSQTIPAFESFIILELKGSSKIHDLASLKLFLHNNHYSRTDLRYCRWKVWKCLLVVQDGCLQINHEEHLQFNQVSNLCSHPVCTNTRTCSPNGRQHEHILVPSTRHQTPALLSQTNANSVIAMQDCKDGVGRWMLLLNNGT